MEILVVKYSKKRFKIKFQRIFKLADRMRSMRTNGASKNRFWPDLSVAFIKYVELVVSFCFFFFCFFFFCLYTYGMYTYGMYTYGMYTYG